MFRLHDLSERTLARLASAVARGRAVTVVLGTRDQALARVGAGDALVYVNEERATLGDTLFCAALLRAERQIRDHPGTVPLSEEVVQALAGEIRARLRQELPGLFRMPGELLHGRALPAVHNELPPYPARLDERGGPTTSWTLGAGAEEDAEEVAERFLADLESGRVPQVECPELPGVPVATTPLTLKVPAVRGRQHAALFEELAGIERSAQAMAACMGERAQGQLPEPIRPRRLRSGKRLDEGRLHDAAMAFRVGGAPRAFLQPAQTLVRRFDPTSHLVGLLIDLGALHAGVLHEGLVRERTLSRRFVLGIVRALALLGADTVILAFCDQLVTLPSGRRVLVREPATIKALHEPLDDVTYLRLGRAMDQPPDLGAPAACFPLVYGDLARAMREAARPGRHRSFGTIGLTPRGIEDPALQSVALLRRAAESTDALMARLEQDLPGLWEQTCFGPASLRYAAPRDGWTARTTSL